MLKGLIERLLSRKFMVTAVAVIAGVVGIDEMSPWIIAGMAGLYIVGNVAEAVLLKWLELKAK